MSAPIDDGGPAFPVTCSNDGIPLAISYPSEQVSGMSLRDWFAGQAIMSATMMENQSRKEPTYKGIATRAYMLADAMIAARKGGER